MHGRSLSLYFSANADSFAFPGARRAESSRDILQRQSGGSVPVQK